MGVAMTTAAPGQPLIPQPPATVTALRQAISQIAPAALPAFTRSWTKLPTSLGKAPIWRRSSGSSPNGRSMSTSSASPTLRQTSAAGKTPQSRATSAGRGWPPLRSGGSCPPEG